MMAIEKVADERNAHIFCESRTTPCKIAVEGTEFSAAEKAKW